MLLSLLVSQVIISMQFFNVASFYPLFVENRFGSERINSTMTSVAMCSFEFAGMTCSFTHKGTINKLGKKGAMAFGFSLCIIAVGCMGALSIIPVDWWRLFFGLSVLTRFIQGYGDSLVRTCFYSSVSQVFPEDKVDKMGYLLAASGAGLIAGPSIGSLIFGYLGFAHTFYVFSAILGLAFVQHLVYVPS